MRDDYEKIAKRLREVAERKSNSLNTRDVCRDAANAVEELQEELQKALDALNDAHNEGYDVGYWAGRRDYEPKWISAEKKLPEKDGKYIVHIRDIDEGREICGVSCVDASYITTAFFDKSQMIWKEYDDIDCSCYNAALSAIGTKNRAYISHWMPMPEWPKEV